MKKDENKMKKDENEMKKDENETKKRRKEKKMKVVSNEDEETINKKQKITEIKLFTYPIFKENRQT
jgi:hypothetical protein